MPIIKFVKGDLIEMTKDGYFDVVGHGANCFHTMGAGIAPKLNALTEGKLLDVDRTTSYGDINKLGSISCCAHEVNGRKIRFVNLYTQFNYGMAIRGGMYVHWDSVSDAIIAMICMCPLDMHVGIPLIGCGLAGGTREQFEDMLHGITDSGILIDRSVDLTVVELPEKGTT